MGCCTSRQIADSSTSAPSRAGLSPTQHTSDSTAAIIRPAHANDSTLTTPSTRLPNPHSSNSLHTSTGAAVAGGGGSGTTTNTHTTTARPPRLVALSGTGGTSTAIGSGSGSGTARPVSISTVGTHASSTNLSTSNPLAERASLPLRPHGPFSTKSRLWTRSQLRRERTDFFETTVTGRPEVWAALRTVAELVREGDYGTAQAVLDAVGFTMPTGDLVDGGYDEGGALYRVPAVVLADPRNVVEDEGDGDDGAAANAAAAPTSNEATTTASPPNTARGSLVENKYATAAAAADQDESETDSEDDDVAGAKEAAALRKREEKGKGSERDSVRVKARLSDRGGPDVVVLLGKGESVGALARRVRGEACLSDDVRVRIAYLGKMLKETEPLLAQGWKEGHVVNALVALPS